MRGLVRTLMTDVQIAADNTSFIIVLLLMHRIVPYSYFVLQY
jgi:hypothetical protein